MASKLDAYILVFLKLLKKLGLVKSYRIDSIGVARWSNGWVVGLRVRGFFPRGFDPRTRNEKYLWDALCLPPTRRRSEVGGAEPEIWRSPNQKRSITIPNADGRTLKKPKRAMKALDRSPEKT